MKIKERLYYCLKCKSYLHKSFTILRNNKRRCSIHNMPLSKIKVTDKK
jgi:hypothetical protein